MNGAGGVRPQPESERANRAEVSGGVQPRKTQVVDRLRLVTWNCEHGAMADRVADLDSLDADLILLQECGPSPAHADSAVYFPGTRRKGVGVATRLPWRVRALPQSPDVKHSGYMARVDGPEAFNVLAVWAWPDPTYAAAVHRVLDAYGDSLRDMPAVAIGDFNSSPALKAHGAAAAHAELIARLDQEFGLVSAWHVLHGEDEPERPTLYHQRRQVAAYQVDYCFIPKAWIRRLMGVEIPGYAAFGSSDHRPVIVDVRVEKT